MYLGHLNPPKAYFLWSEKLYLKKGFDDSFFLHNYMDFIFKFQNYFLYYFYFFLLFILFLHSILSFEILYLYLHKKEKPPFFYGGSVIYTYYIDNKSKVFILLLLLSI